MPTPTVTYEWLTAEDNCPPPGRASVTLDEARAVLVDETNFESSITREQLWGGLEQYLSRFIFLETHFAELLEGAPLVRFLWMGGSYVSGELNPKNIDMTVAVDHGAKQRLRNQPRSGWVSDAFHRARVLQEFGLSPLELVYTPVVSVFDRRLLEPEQREYLEARGSWDDWWQRRRKPGAETGAPTLDTVEARRGYLEVTL